MRLSVPRPSTRSAIEAATERHVAGGRSTEPAPAPDVTAQGATGDGRHTAHASERDAELEVATADDLVDALCALLEQATGPERTQTAARFAPFVEAGHDPELLEPLARGRAPMEAPLVLALAGLGVRDPRAAAAVVVPCMQGLLLRRISRLADADPRPVVSRVVHAVLG